MAMPAADLAMGRSSSFTPGLDAIRWTCHYERGTDPAFEPDHGEYATGLMRLKCR